MGPFSRCAIVFCHFLPFFAATWDKQTITLLSNTNGRTEIDESEALVEVSQITKKWSKNGKSL